MENKITEFSSIRTMGLKLTVLEAYHEPCGFPGCAHPPIASFVEDITANGEALKMGGFRSSWTICAEHYNLFLRLWHISAKNQLEFHAGLRKKRMERMKEWTGWKEELTNDG